MKDGEIEKLVCDKLNELNITFRCEYCGEKQRWGAIQDSWEIIFSSPHCVVSFDFFAGLGHRNERRIVQPSSATALYCLSSDFVSIKGGFKVWCENTGYSDDSISAFKAYKLCVKNSKKLSKVFYAAQIYDFQKILTDF